MILVAVVTTPAGPFIWLGLAGIVIGAAVWKSAQSADHNLISLEKPVRRRNSRRSLL
jgi:hypothetical protein